MKKPGPPPIREIVIHNNRFKEGFALWLSNLSSLVARADNSANSTVSVASPNAANVTSTVSVTSPNATDLASVLVLANELKSDLNQLVSDLNNLLVNSGTITLVNETKSDVNQLVSDVNDLKTKLRNAGIIES